MSYIVEKLTAGVAAVEKAYKSFVAEEEREDSDEITAGNEPTELEDSSDVDGR